MYIPHPMDTSRIFLDDELQKLVEELAVNVHENWAEGRIKEGWSYGDVRDEALKQHPCLVPYNELPESEKEYDRRTAEETLKTIISYGYIIKKR